LYTKARTAVLSRVSSNNSLQSFGTEEKEKEKEEVNKLPKRQGPDGLKKQIVQIHNNLNLNGWLKCSYFYSSPALLTTP
jgi:hypothetical protein